MRLQAHIIYAAVAALLFFLINWLGSHSRNFGYVQLSLHLRTDEAPAFNFVLKAFAPVVATILFATLAYSIGLDEFVVQVWLIAAYYWLLRIGINVLLGRGRLLNWPLLLLQSSVSIGAAFLTYRHLILPRHPLFPKAADVGSQLWVIIALFLYATFNSARSSSAGPERRKVAYIRRQYSMLSAAYGSLVTEGVKGRADLVAIAYAIMIHENFNRPPLLRSLERLLGPRLVKTFGLMQVQASTRLDDSTSVRLGLEKLQAAYDRFAAKRGGDQWSMAHAVVADFNRDDEYIMEVMQIKQVLTARVIGSLSAQSKPEEVGA
jgi:hypothetical protein